MAKNNFAEGHIQGTRNLPWHNVDELFMDAAQDISQDKLIITYCDGETITIKYDY